jgi:hypothetical protein
MKLYLFQLAEMEFLQYFMDIKLRLHPYLRVVGSHLYDKAILMLTESHIQKLQPVKNILNFRFPDLFEGVQITHILYNQPLEVPAHRQPAQTKLEKQLQLTITARASYEHLIELALGPLFALIQHGGERSAERRIRPEAKVHPLYFVGLGNGWENAVADFLDVVQLDFVEVGVRVVLDQFL